MNEKKHESVRLTGQDLALGRLLASGIPGGSNMSDCPELEQLSAFIDGKLSRENRDNVVSHLAGCEACYAVVSESLMIRSEMAHRSHAIRPHARRRKYLATWVSAGLAAAAALLVVVRIWQPSPEFTGKPVPETAFLSAPANEKTVHKPVSPPVIRSYAREMAGRLGKSVSAGVPASGSRAAREAAFGFASSVPLEKAAFRIGVCLTDLEVALKAKDREKVELYAKKLVELLKPMEASYGLIPSIVEPGGTIAKAVKEERRYEGVSRAVEALFENKKEAVFMKFGAWVEAASLAAEARDAAFFQPAAVKDFRAELEKGDIPLGMQKDLPQLESIISAGIRTDQFKAVDRLLADIKEMY